jgi:hypothetical protein
MHYSEVSAVMEDEEDIEKLKEVLSVISTEIPKLLDSINKSAFSPENAEKLAQATAKFYKEMVNAGMDERQAYELTQKFMSNFSMGSMMSQILGGLGRHGGGNDVGDVMKEQVEKKIRDKMDKSD